MCPMFINHDRGRERQRYKIERERAIREEGAGYTTERLGGEGNFFKGHILYCKEYLSRCIKCYHCKSCCFYSERNKHPRNLTLKAFKVSEVSSYCQEVHAEPYMDIS